MEQWDAIFPALLLLFPRHNFVVPSLTLVGAFARFPR
jgi:hypothetical protein